MMVPEIEFKNVSKSYGENTIIEGFNLSIEKGEFVTVIGASGSGKTTLLKMINSLILPDMGCIWVKGRDTLNENVIKLRRNIGYAVQGNVLFPHMTVEENISYVPNLLNKKDKSRSKQAVKKWIDLMGLDYDMLSRYPEELSGGQQQRVGIARSLAASPDILLMDEPFGAVDQITKVKLQKEIMEIHKKTHLTVVFITHDISEALKLGTKVLVLDAGKIIQYASADEILNSPASELVKALTASYVIID